MLPRLLSFQHSTTLAALAVAGLLSSCAPLRNAQKTINGTAQGTEDGNTQQEPTTIGRTHQFGVLDDTVDFVADGKDNLPVLKSKFPIHDDDSEISLLADGPDFLAARSQLIEQATQTIRIQSLVFHGDESGWFLADKLIAKKKQGVDVKIIIDSVSNIYPEDQSLFLYIQQNGIPVEGYEVFYLYAFQEINLSDDPQTAIEKFNKRYHEKMFVVDAGVAGKAMAIIGGANIANKYFRIDQTKHEANWRDKDVIVRGSVVSDIAASFDENLKTMQDFRANKALFNTSPLWNLALHARNILKLNPLIPSNRPALNAAFTRQITAYSQIQLNLNWQKARMRFLKSRPQLGERYIHAAYLDLIKSAKKEILLLNSYFLPTEDLRAALKDAVRRGVNVTVLTNDVRVSDYQLVMLTGRTLYSELLAVNQESTTNGAKLSIYEWAGDPQFGNKLGLHHAKYAIFDESVSIVGSFNIDPRSSNLNSESAIVYENSALALTLKAEFIKDAGPTFAIPIDAAKAASFMDSGSLIDKFKTQFGTAIFPIL